MHEGQNLTEQPTDINEQPDPHFGGQQPHAAFEDVVDQLMKAESLQRPDLCSVKEINVT